jgi:hypothetical protein
MKSIVLSSLILLASACNNQPTKKVDVDMIDNPATASNPTAESKNTTEMTFETMDHNFGDIIEGQSVEKTYYFTNTGKTPLLIDRCDVTCGCTVPSFPKTPIAPGEKGAIKVVFNSSGKSGLNNKTVTVFANVKDGNMVLKFTANVIVVPTKN